ncbi:Attacin-E [Eumeta japonica]|uniref:Attacin-E n=1 Tax=Eumeta variegata TaxID=151549 RepID=A0A4C1V348_EUMVA|nr:Attacin-E [Eumeta japonica]
MTCSSVLFLVVLFFGVQSMSTVGTPYPVHDEDLALVNIPDQESLRELMRLGYPIYHGVLDGTAYPTYNENVVLVNGPDEESLSELTAPQHPVYNSGHRTRRQVHGVMNTNPDGSVNLNAQVPLASNGRNVLSAVGGVDAFQQGKGKYGSATAGLALDNAAGHGLSLTNRHISGFGDQLTAAGRVNLLNTDRHNLNANAFATRTMPNNPMVPNFNTRGGGLYMYNNKIGASLSAAHTDLFKRTDLSAMGKLNLFKSPSSSLDFSAGATRSMSPYIPKSSWQPSGGLTFSRFF